MCSMLMAYRDGCNLVRVAWVHTDCCLVSKELQHLLLHTLLMSALNSMLHKFVHTIAQ